MESRSDKKNWLENKAIKIYKRLGQHHPVSHKQNLVTCITRCLNVRGYAICCQHMELMLVIRTAGSTHKRRILKDRVRYTWPHSILLCITFDVDILNAIDSLVDCLMACADGNTLTQATNQKREEKCFKMRGA